MGRDVDEGFRIAKYAVKDKIIVSPLLVWMIWKDAQKDDDRKKVIHSNFKITSFVTMKGVWRNRKVPIVMFHQKFDDFKNQLAYDELDLETYSNIKNVGFEGFKADESYDVERIDSILENVFRKKAAEEAYDWLVEEKDVQFLPINRESIQELHLACIIFNEKNQILIHNHPNRGREFGCVKKIFNADTRKWKEVCESGYREKYNLQIKLDEDPIPYQIYTYLCPEKSVRWRR